MRRIASLLACMLLMLPALAAAQTGKRAIVTSDGPDRVEVSMYRDNRRGPNQKLNLRNLRGFALITETRTVTLAAGPATVRFEGVASGIDPASALVKGIGLEEKNQDAQLLTQRGLLDHFTGQRVTLRRTDPATGKVTEESATIRSGSDRLIVQTEAGFESIACTGLNQMLVFDRAPDNLSTKPTLSAAIGDQPGGRYTITLTYLTQNFDWQANYVAQLSDDAKSVDILGWMTMASGDSTSFVNANANAIAGTVFRDRAYNNLYNAARRPVSYQCWPAGNTGLFEGYRYQQRVFALRDGFEEEADGAMVQRSAPMMEMVMDTPALPPPPPPPPALASQENLGDLKLYRIPFPTTVAANSQKQVAFLQKEGVTGEVIYQLAVAGDDRLGGLSRIFRMQNTKDDGLGEPLPSGQFAFFQQASGLGQLVGEDTMADKAIGEEIELVLGEANNVSYAIEAGKRSGKNWRSHVLTISNANPVSIVFEGEFLRSADYRYRKFSHRTFERDGKTVASVSIGPNESWELRYRVYDVRVYEVATDE